MHHKAENEKKNEVSEPISKAMTKQMGNTVKCKNSNNLLSKSQNKKVANA